MKNKLKGEKLKMKHKKCGGKMVLSGKGDHFRSYRCNRCLFEKKIYKRRVKNES